MLEPFSYLPIEALRDEAEAWFRGKNAVRAFRSSGTTSASRSTSLFSGEGLARYRQESVAAFRAILTQAAGAESVARMRGISLIPPADASGWPDSSLAQMVAWIAAELPVQYVELEELPATLARLQTDEPVWLFGTAFHHVIAIDDGLARALPPGSVVFETGGTKGRTRSVTREEVFAMCSAAYGVPRGKIVSEYGMCELASQAYDLAPDDRPLAERWFAFPKSVKLGVVARPGEVRSEGEGLLLVDDPARIDLPRALRTEDLARLRVDGTFQLIGRAPAAPLRGCSLSVEEAGAEQPAAHMSVRRDAQRITVDDAGVLARIPAVRDTILAFLRGERAQTLLSAELGSRRAALQALDDLARGMPASDAAWLDAARAAAGGKDDVLRRWLFILPRSHGLVVCYPASIAHLLGLDVTARIPEGMLFAAAFAAALGLRTVGPELVLHDDAAAHDFDGLLAYGTNETIAALSASSGLFVSGFGDHATASLGDVATLERDAPLIARDALATAQRGCLATRLLVLRGDVDTSLDNVAACLSRALGAFREGRVAPADELGFERAAWRFERAGFSVFPGSTLVAVKAAAHVDARELALHPFTLPVVVIREKDASRFVKMIEAELTPTCGTLTIARELRTHLVKYRQRATCLRELGDANAPRWDGFHLSLPLFARAVEHAMITGTR